MTAEVQELAAAELAAWRGMLKVHSALVKALDAELDAAHNLPLSSYEVLIYLRVAPDKRLRMAELADRTLLSRSGMTRLVDRLERDGLLRRDTCSSDARGCFAVLTESGEELLTEARATHLAGVRRRFLDHLDEEDIAALGAAFNKVLAGNRDLSPGDLEKT
jgi:DNA-binding MarR family transcriptional regulator